jgi:hypothetical protein
MRRELIGAMMLAGACGGSSANAPETATAATPEEHAPAAAGASGACEELATTCHGHEEGHPLVAECHMIGHDADAEACNARHQECMAACQQAAEAHAHAAE